MTCIVGYADGVTVWMGGDSAATDDQLVVGYRAPKVFRRGRALLFGVAQSFRMRDILHHDLVVPRRPRGMSDDDYLVTQLVEEIRLTFHACGFEKDFRAEGKDVDHGAVLIGYHGRLFTLDWDYHLGEANLPYAALGSGGDYALGALHALLGPGGRPELREDERLLAALTASAELSPSVRSPFCVLRMR